MPTPSVPETPEAIRGFPKVVRSLSGLSDTVNNAMIGNKFSNMIFLGTLGNVAIVLEDNSVIVMPSPIIGVWHAMPPFKRINSTGTHSTITAIIGIAFK